MRLAAIAVLLALAAAPARAKDAKVPPEIQKTVDSWQTAFNAQDAKKVAAVFAPDGTFINPRGQGAKGRPDIERRFAEDFQGPLRGATAQAHVANVRMLGRDFAFVEVDQQVSGPNLPSDVPSPRTAHVALVMHRKGNGWEVLDARPHFWIRPPGAPDAAGGGGAEGASGSAPGGSAPEPAAPPAGGSAPEPAATPGGGTETK